MILADAKQHTDFRTEKYEVRRARRLVVSSFTTVANYDYGFNWHFYQDGTIEVGARFSQPLTSEVRERLDWSLEYASTFWGRKLRVWNSCRHQYYRNKPSTFPRSTIEHDGRWVCVGSTSYNSSSSVKNCLYEVNSLTKHPSDKNVMKNSFVAQTQQIKSEKESGRVCDQLRAR